MSALGKVCKDLQLPPKWKMITGKEVNFSHRSVPAIFRAMAILKEKRNPEAHPVPGKLQVDNGKVIAAKHVQLVNNNSYCNNVSRLSYICRLFPL